PPALPHAVPQMQQAEARPVARGSVVEAGHDEVAPRVGLEDEMASADGIEELPLGKGEVVLSTPFNRLANNLSEGEGIAVAIAPLGVRRNLERLIDRMVEHVESVEVDAHVFVRTGERLGPVQAEVPEIEPAAHVEQIAHADLPA